MKAGQAYGDACTTVLAATINFTPAGPPPLNPGTVTTGATSWGAGGVYALDMADAAAGPGVGWDLWNVGGLLSIDASTTTNGRFTLELTTLSGENPGPAANFSTSGSYHWLIAHADSIPGFDPAKFTIDTTHFANPLDGRQFTLTQVGGDIYLNSVPEPGTIALLAAGVIGLLMCVWRRKRTP